MGFSRLRMIIRIPQGLRSCSQTQAIDLVTLYACQNPIDAPLSDVYARCYGAVVAAVAVAQPGTTLGKALFKIDETKRRNMTRMGIIIFTIYSFAFVILISIILRLFLCSQGSVPQCSGVIFKCQSVCNFKFGHDSNVYQFQITLK